MLLSLFESSLFDEELSLFDEVSLFDEELSLLLSIFELEVISSLVAWFELGSRLARTWSPSFS